MVRTLRSSVPKLRSRPLPWFLLGCSVFLYLHLFRLPWTPLLIRGNQDIYLLGGMRMLDGQVIYRDFFDFVAPGADVVYFVLFRIFGIRAWIPNVMLLVLGVGLTWLTVVISRRIMDGASVFLPGLTFLTFSFRFQLDATHHWYSAMAVLAALAVVIEARSPRRLAAAGVLCGVASFFTQTRGAMGVLGLAVFLLWEARTKRLGIRALLKNEILLLSSFSITTAALYAYFIYQAGLTRVVDCIIIFLFRYSTSAPSNNWARYLRDYPAYHPWYRFPNLGAWLFMSLFPPVVYVLCLLRYGRESAGGRQSPRDRWVAMLAVGLFLLLGIIRAPSFQRLSADSLPALILLVWLVDTQRWLPRAVRRTLWVAALLFAFLTPLSAQCLYSPRYLEVPAGRIALYDARVVEQLEWLLHRTRPGDYFWGDSTLNFCLRLRDISGVPFLTTTDFTRPEQVRRIIEELERHQVRFVEWETDLHPAYAASGGDHLGPLRDYLRAHYRVTKTSRYHGESLWERQP